jgi:hypothetical protein
MGTNYLIDNNVLIPTATAQTVVVGDKYEIKCGLHVSANNAFYGTFWLEGNQGVIDTGLSTGSYTVYDADRNASATLTQTGITPDVNGIYRLTPVSAAELIDLTHFDIEFEASVDGTDIKTRWSFNLGE